MHISFRFDKDPTINLFDELPYNHSSTNHENKVRNGNSEYTSKNSVIWFSIIIRKQVRKNRAPNCNKGYDSNSTKHGLYDVSNLTSLNHTFLDFGASNEANDCDNQEGDVYYSSPPYHPPVCKDGNESDGFYNQRNRKPSDACNSVLRKKVSSMIVFKVMSFLIKSK